MVTGSIGHEQNDTVYPPPLLNWNQTGFGIQMAQFGLQRLGFYPRSGALNGHYGPVTANAIKAFQRRYGCPVADNKANFPAASWYDLVNGRVRMGVMPMLRLNETSLGVEMTQFGLQRLGFYPGSGQVNGHYGPVTSAAIRAFQKHYDTVPAGGAALFGLVSWSALTNAS